MLLAHALSLYPRNVRVLVSLAECEEKTGNWQAAEQLYRTALEIQPTHVVSLHRLATLLYKMQDKGAEVRVALRLSLCFVSVCAERTCGVLTLSTFQQAEALYKRALEADKKHVRALSEFAAMCAQRGDVEQAERLFKAALEEGATDPAVMCAYANFLWGKKKLIPEVRSRYRMYICILYPCSLPRYHRHEHCLKRP